MKKLKMPLSTLIINIVIAVLVIVSAVLVIVGYTDSLEPVKDYTRLSFILMLIAMCAFVLLTNAAVFTKKVQMFILIPILVIFFTLSTIETFFVSAITAGEENLQGSTDLLGATSPVLGLAILALFIVSIIFALKGKKWGAITTIVILSLSIYNVYTLIVVVKAALAAVETEQAKSILLIYGLGIVLIAQVVYFVSLLYPKHQEQVEEPQANKQVISEEPVNTETVEPETITTEE